MLRYVHDIHKTLLMYYIRLLCIVTNGQTIDLVYKNLNIYISGASPITNGTATVAVDGLECGVTYTVIAGGTFNGDLVGPRSLLSLLVAVQSI